MKVLVIFVHPSPTSFCAGLLAHVCAGLRAAGHEVQIADLYAEGFNPAFQAEDFAQFAGTPMPADVLREQARFEWSEGVVIVSPIWWYQFPAMLKGWIDRVFSAGWAFESLQRPEPVPSLGWRPLLVLASAGASPQTFDKYGYMEGIRALWDTGIWGYCGFTRRRTEFFWKVQPRSLSPAERAAHEARAFALGQQFGTTVPGSDVDTPG